MNIIHCPRHMYQYNQPSWLCCGSIWKPLMDGDVNIKLPSYEPYALALWLSLWDPGEGCQIKSTSTCSPSTRWAIEADQHLYHHRFLGFIIVGQISLFSLKSYVLSQQKRCKLVMRFSKVEGEYVYRCTPAIFDDCCRAPEGKVNQLWRFRIFT